MTKRHLQIGAALAGLCMLAACGGPEIAPPAMRPLSKDAMMLLGKKGMKVESPIFVRIFKEESELEIWKARDDGNYYHFKTYPICTWSGELGPKVAQGDRQAPEGFYVIHRSQMNPNSSFHLAFNMGFPNAYDKANGRTGSALMVHGKCRSAGCYAMTDALIEEIYALAREQYANGQESFPVHAFPFRMTAENMERHKSDKWFAFWQTLKEGYDYFETTRKVPTVAICERKYHVNVKPVKADARIEPEARCPAFERQTAEAFKPSTSNKVADVHVVAQGPKMRGLAAAQSTPEGGSRSTGSILSGLLKSPPASRSTGIGFAPGN